MRVPAGSQCVACLSGLDEDNLPIREGDYERVVIPTHTHTRRQLGVCSWKGRRRTTRDEDDSTNLMRDIGHPEERIRSLAQVGVFAGDQSVLFEYDGQLWYAHLFRGPIEIS
jgi:hypothetical protein